MMMLMAFVVVGQMKLTKASMRRGLGKLMGCVKRFRSIWPKRLILSCRVEVPEILPWILQRPQNSEDEAKPQLVLPNPAFDKTKTPPPNKRQRIKACVEGTVDTLGHKWTLGSESASNLTMRCEICGLYVQQVLLQDRFDQLMRHPCKDHPSVLPPAWDIHHSHKMF